MARYIDADLLLKDIGESVVFTVRNAETSPELRGARKIIDRIKQSPTADVVEVVRCKDCKHCQQYQKWNFDKYLGCNFNEEIYEVEPNHFCSYGERKETNDR